MVDARFSARYPRAFGLLIGVLIALCAIPCARAQEPAGGRNVNKLSQLRGDVRTLGLFAPEDGQVLGWHDGAGDDDYWMPVEPGGGGGGDGLQVVGTPNEGDSVRWNEYGGASGQWEPTAPGAGVINIDDLGGSPRGEVTTTGNITSGAASLVVASATTFAKGQAVGVYGAGSAHGLSTPGAPIIGVLGTAGSTTYEIGIAAISAGGGYTPVASGSTTVGNATISSTNAIYACWRTLSGACGYIITGDSSTQSARCTIGRKNRATNAYMLTFQAGGYVNADQTDIGKLVTRGTSTGILAGFDNTNRRWWIIPTVYGTDTFASFGDVVISAGTGDGTTTAVEAAHVWKYSGHTAAIATETQPSVARRASSAYKPGDIIMHPVHPTNGEWWMCLYAMPADADEAITSATATGSLTLGSAPNAAGTRAQDGDIIWMRVDLPIPIDEPTSAVQNILRTTIASTSGTTFTLADNAGTSVTGGRVVHDNYQAFSAALALALTANYSADTIYLGPGIRPMILGDSEADPWSQWDDSRVAANVAFGFGSTNANRIIRFQQSTGSVLPIWGLSSRGQHADSGDQDFFFSTNFSRDFTWAGGNTIYVDAAEPKIIADDAWNRLYFYNDFSAGALQRIQGTKFLDANLYGFGRLVAIGTNKGLGSGLVIDGGDHTYGGAGHDAWVFGTFGRISNVNVCGHIGFGSTLIYTDDPGVEDRVIIDNLKVRRSRTDGIRLRSGNALLSNVHWVDCKDSLTLFENFVGGVENCTATNGGVMNLGGMFSASNLVFTNAQLNIVGGTGSVNGGSITFNTSADSYFSTSPHCCTVNNSGDVTINGLVITNQETSGPNRGIAVIGTGRTTLNAVHSWCASGYAIDIGSAMSGKAFLNGGYYRGAGGPQSNWMDFHVNGSVICRGVTFDAETASNTLYVDQGTLEFYNCHLLHALAGGPTTLVMKDCYLPAASASAVGVYTTGTCEGNRFGVAPTSTTPSLITFAGNKVNESSSVTVSSPIAASADNYALPVTDLAIVTLTGNQNFTGAAACANGTVKMILNDDGADTLTVKHLTTSSAANQIITPSGGDLAIGPRKRLKLERMDDIWYATAP